MNFSFVEIGSNCYDTLADKLDGVGLLLEPIPLYFHRIPHRPNIIKRCSALVPQGLTHNPYMYTWDEADIPHDKGHVRGCSSFLENHACKNDAPNRKKVQVHVLTWPNLIDIYCIKSIDYLKLDCEGLDVPLVLEFLALPNRPRVGTIQLETNANTDKPLLLSLYAQCQIFGFDIVYEGHDTILRPSKPDIL